MRHLTQSHYAWNFLFTRFDVLASSLTDYTDATGINYIPAGLNPSRPIVAYNAAKGANLVTELQQRMPAHVLWTPIKSMTKLQVRSCLSQADVYLDLGQQPGKDRLPREAALSGAIVLVARRGAGALSTDCPIPIDHKIDISNGDLTHADAVLTCVIASMSQQLARQDPYRHAIRQERAIFQHEVNSIFAADQHGRDWTTTSGFDARCDLS